MAILDGALVFSDAQAVTATAASDNYVDTLAAGDSYDGAWLVIRVDTTFTGSGSPTLTVDVQVSTTSTFSSTTTLASFGAIAKATLVATSTLPGVGYQAKLRIPPGALRYMRVYYTASSSFSAGKIDAFVVKDADILIT